MRSQDLLWHIYYKNLCAYTLTVNFVFSSISFELVAFQQSVGFRGNKPNRSFHSSFAFRLFSCQSHLGSSFWNSAVYTCDQLTLIATFMANKLSESSKHRHTRTWCQHGVTIKNDGHVRFFLAALRWRVSAKFCIQDCKCGQEKEQNVRTRCMNVA